MTRTTTRIAIIGAGFGGLAAAIELKKRGFDDIVVLEKGQDVGGVWRENTYPGAACDVPSPFYSYSFEPNPRWPHRFSRQPAILDYARHVADKYDVRRHIRFGTEVAGADFDGQWTITLTSGETITADVLVPAVGQLSRPSYPNIAGRDSFEGPTFHSATWDHELDLTGKRVAVIGTGASAIQFVPELQKVVGHLDVFQRTPPYLVPRLDQKFSPVHHKIFEKLPFTHTIERATWYASVESFSVAWAYSKALSRTYRAMARSHMKRGAKAQPGLFEKVWPTYPIGCKRVLFSNNYLPALAQPNVDLVTEGIQEITPAGVRTKDGVEHPADVIVWGTGFTTTEFLAPMKISSGGRPLADEWATGAHAYYGLTVPGFPNLVVMYGPNTNTGGGSVIYFLEVQASYLADYVEHLIASNGALDVRREVEQAYDEAVQTELSGSVWSRCNSWYRQADGRITTNWPWLGAQYKARAKFRAADYEVVAR